MNIPVIVALAFGSLTLVLPVREVRDSEAARPTTLVLLVPFTQDCFCVTTTGAVANHNSTVILCDDGSTAAVLSLSTVNKVHGKCTKDPTCMDPSVTNCSATVKAELQWVSSCYSILYVVGPGIGTTQSPCQPQAYPYNKECSWPLEAECKTGGPNTDAGSLAFTVYTAPCVNGQPSGNPVADFLEGVS